MVLGSRNGAEVCGIKQMGTLFLETFRRNGAEVCSIKQMGTLFLETFRIVLGLKVQFLYLLSSYFSLD
jgi:hypothetical protein